MWRQKEGILLLERSMPLCDCKKYKRMKRQEEAWI